MKKTASILLCSLSAFMFGQISIGKKGVSGESTLLDFDDTVSNTMGIILPAVNGLSNALSSNVANNNGTFLFDKSDNKVKMYENGVWVDLSEEGKTDQLVSNPTLEVGKGVIFGAETTEAKGVLVLEATDKAMILPKIANPHLTVKNPYPGMMCYDTVGKVLAVFDGQVWNYWR